jgi:hypothetical protein
MAAIINRANVRTMLLNIAKKNRYHKFTRVSSDTYDVIEAHLREWCEQKISELPSKGKTILFDL